MSGGAGQSATRSPADRDDQGVAQGGRNPTPAYRTVDMYFPDYELASASVTTDEADALFESIFALATGGVRILFCDIEES